MCERLLSFDLCGKSFAELPPVLFGDNIMNHISPEMNCAAFRRSCLFGTICWLETILWSKFSYLIIFFQFVRGYTSFVIVFLLSAEEQWQGQKLPLLVDRWAMADQPRASEATKKHHTSWLWLVSQSGHPHAGDCIYQADVLIMKCYWTLIQKQYCLLFWFCRNLERLCNEWWYSGCSGDLTTPDHSPSQREVFRQSGWEQSRILAREEHGTRPSPGLQYDGAKKEGVHDSAKSRKRSFVSDQVSSSFFHYFSSYALLYVS